MNFMTETKKIREIKIEVERVRVISNLKKSRSICENCSAESEFISLSNALQIFETTEIILARMAKEKLIHLKLGVKNELLICLPSLLLAKEFF